MRIATCMSILLSLATPASAEVHTSLPFGGYYRIGRYMPLVVRFDAADATGPIEIRATGAVPVTIDPRNSAGELIIPLLVIAPLSDLRIVTSSGDIPVETPLRQAGADDYIVGFTPGLIPAGAILGIEIHNLPAVATIPVAWELFDELRVERLDLLDERSIACILAAGTIIADATGKTVLADPAGPAGAIVGESGYLPVIGDGGGGLAATTRRQVVLAACAFAILTTACALLIRPARPRLAAVIVVCVGTSFAIALWRRALPRVREKGGTVIVERAGGMLQRDRWTFASAGDEVQLDMPLRDTLRPVLLDAAHARKTGLRLRVTNGPGPPVFRMTLGRGMSMAFMSRTIERDAAATVAAEIGLDSPLVALAQAIYKRPGLRIAGGTAPAGAGDWPGVALRAE